MVSPQSLTVVGTGIRFGLQTTGEAMEAIIAAEKVLHVMTEPRAEQWLGELNTTAESLARHYETGRPRDEVYQAMAEDVLDWLDRGRSVCLVLYGHPGVFATPGHLAVRLAREAGHKARMLPAVSAEDCLFADLGIDPGDGLVSLEAVNVLDGRVWLWDPRAHLVLWQVAAIGERVVRDAPVREGLTKLAGALIPLYGQDHEVVLYESPTLPFGEPTIRRLPLGDLGQCEVSPMMTLWVPPARGEA